MGKLLRLSSGVSRLLRCLASCVKDLRRAGDSPAVQVKGALDPEQADILSAYSTEQGTLDFDLQRRCVHHGGVFGSSVLSSRHSVFMSGTIPHCGVIATECRCLL